MVSGLVGVGRVAFDQLRDLRLPGIGGLTEDPVGALFRLAASLGADFGESAADAAAFARSRFPATTRSTSSASTPSSPSGSSCPCCDHWPATGSGSGRRAREHPGVRIGPARVQPRPGTLPLDGMVLHSVVFDEIGRHVRMLGADLIFATPYSTTSPARPAPPWPVPRTPSACWLRTSSARCSRKASRVWGSSTQTGTQLQRFGRGGFVSAAVRAQVPIIPISIVGSEEIYPLIGRAPGLARVLGVPYFPVTPLFPWFGPLGAVPLPSKWVISFGEAIATDELAPGSADDPMVVFNVTDQVRETIQHRLYALLMSRRGPFG